jgi:hypothetical protein
LAQSSGLALKVAVKRDFLVKPKNPAALSFRLTLARLCCGGWRLALPDAWSEP